MPIIINEFEILSEAPPPPTGGAVERAAGPSPGVTPEDVLRAVSRGHERLERVKAD